MYEPLKETTKEQYLKIWSHYAIGHLNQEQLAKLFNCSPDRIGNAIRWCARNRIQFSSSILTEAAKEAIENRLQELQNDLIKVRETTPANWNAYIGLQRLIKENEELLWQFQTIMQGKGSITVKTTPFQQYDYQTRRDIERHEEECGKVREFVDTLSDEEKRRMLLLMEGLNLDKEVTVDRDGQTTIITIKNAEKVKEEIKNEGRNAALNVS